VRAANAQTANDAAYDIWSTSLLGPSLKERRPQKVTSTAHGVVRAARLIVQYVQHADESPSYQQQEIARIQMWLRASKVCVLGYLCSCRKRNLGPKLLEEAQSSESCSRHALEPTFPAQTSSWAHHIGMFDDRDCSRH
jgi:hypothetical protein